MECNKDEAIRAKVIAERKLSEKDFVGAKKFALKAQALYPELEGLSQMVITLDVYICAENKITGEVDWYGVLGVNPDADDETVKRQYRKLALMLHPDKNKSVGADGAFKLLSEAWSLLSDKAKRLAYNQRRSSKGFQQKVASQSGGQSGPPSANGFHNFPNRSSSNVKTPNPMPRVNPASVPRPSGHRSDTFWTACHRCKMHYEYLRMYLNHTLLCPNCRQSFMASEKAPPSNFSKPPNLPLHQRDQNPTHHFTIGNVGAAPNAGIGGSIGPTVSSPFVAAKAANVVQQANEKVKREREESEGAGGGERPWEKRRGLDGNVNGYGGNTGSQMAMRNRVSDFSGIKYVPKPKSIRDLTPLETRSMLLDKAKTEIHKKLSQWSSETLTKSVDSKKEKMSDVKQKRFVKGDTHKVNRNATSDSNQAKKYFANTPADADKEDAPINVPDPDFHDFDQERTESAFGENQVWAAYDDDDGMPRFYAMIHKVLSLKPFKMRISWLNSKTNSEFSKINWVGSGFYKSCGEFWVGRHEFTKSLNSFSHMVKWKKSPRGSVSILPKKGDVWALYRNWSPNWNEHTPDEVIHKYDMVEVLEDYNEDQGLSVAPLVKVAGFRTVFRIHTDLENVRKVPKEEMLRFSHQVPNHLLSGQEAQDAPKDCQELDPASTPVELLQVVTEANDKKIEGNDKKAGKQKLRSTPEISLDDLVTKTKGEEHMIDNSEESKEGGIGA